MALQAVQTTLDPLLRLRQLADGASHEGVNGLFLKELPLELFLEVASYLTEDLIPFTHVCARWRSALLNHRQLWAYSLSEMMSSAVEVASFESVERVRAVASRAKGALKALDFGFNMSGERSLEIMPVQATLRQVLHEVSALDGAREIKEISMDATEYACDLGIPTDPAFACIVKLAQFIEFSAVNTKKLTINTRLTRFPGGAPFFNAMPSLHELTLTSAGQEPFPKNRLPDFFSTDATIQDTQVTTSALRKFTLEGPSLVDPTFPSLPHLTSLRLSDVNVHNLFGLLSQCANTLKELALHQIRSKPPVTFFPIPPGGGQKDLPPTLYLPYLAELELCGYATALFLWTAPTLSTQSFLIEALSLKKVDFGDQHRLDYELQMEDGLDDWDAYHFLTNENLSTCLRDSPSLVSLKLAGTNATPTMLYAALPNAGPNLSKLILGDNATDDLVNRLHVLCPNLKYLDVQGLHGGHLQVTLPALARLASRLRNSGSAQLPRWLSVWKLTLVTDEPSNHPTTSTLRGELRTLLQSLSSTQVQHLTSTLTLNDPPNALAFAVVKQEVVDLASARHTAGAMGNGNGKLKGAAAVGKPAAPQGIVDSAKVALSKWQKRREDEWSVEWCSLAAGVELVFENEDDEE